MHNDRRCPLGKPWAVVNTEDDRVVGFHISRQAARLQQEALRDGGPALRAEKDPDDAADSKLSDEEMDSARRQPLPPSVAFTTPASTIW